MRGLNPLVLGKLKLKIERPANSISNLFFFNTVKWARKVPKRSACLCVHCHAEKHMQRAQVSGQAKCRVYFRESGKIAAAQAAAWSEH